MRKLLNTLYVTNENSYLTLDGENIVVLREKDEVGRFPLHMLESIITFSYPGASPSLMGECANRNIDLVFCTPRGKFLARTVGKSHGNVLLRRTQYRIADCPSQRITISRNFIFGKIYNCRQSLQRTIRDHSLRVNCDLIKSSSDKLSNYLQQINQVYEDDELRGLEGVAANAYFASFNELILNNKNTFNFTTRNRRPPLDKVNALLSFAYSLLTNDCCSALESVGLDPYVGFLHTDRPGRSSLALDLMEELRPIIADRFVITQINNRCVSGKDFTVQESGAVRLTDEARKAFLKDWQKHKTIEIKHPYLNEKVPWGLVPYTQALLLSRCLREDIDGYPPFLWK